MTIGPLSLAACIGLTAGVIRYTLPRIFKRRDRETVTISETVAPISRVLPVTQPIEPQPANDTRYIVNPKEYNATECAKWLPVIVQEKYDGIRATIRDGAAYSRSGKLIPNLSFQAWVAANAAALDSCDGEILAGNSLQDAQSFAMSKHSKVDFTYMIFNAEIDGFMCAPSHVVDNMADIQAALARIDSQGGEGVVIKTMTGNKAMKLKAWQDSEGIVTARDGARVTLLWNDKTFAIAAPRTTPIGALVKFKYRGLFATGRPRDASFICIRNGATMPVIVKPDNTVMIGEAVSAMINLGLKKRDAKAHVQAVYDSMTGTISLNNLVRASVKALAT